MDVNEHERLSNFVFEGLYEHEQLSNSTLQTQIKVHFRHKLTYTSDTN